jgi:hypothetical protein
MSLAARLDAMADDLADYAYNRMQKSEEANAVFALAQQCRQMAERLDDAGDRSVEGAAPSLGVLERVVGVAQGGDVIRC